MKVVELHGVGKHYWQLEEQAMLLKSLLPFTRPKRHPLWALRDIDLTIEQGETVGILGRNGAGKTTLLRLLAGVTQPSEGTLTLRGRVAPLISVGVGFHAEMSGRENIYVNGMLLGLTRVEVDERFADIVAFSELAEFIDTPVKFYSSGMFMRLGFTVAIHTDPDILLVDEVLAVGDHAFRIKCIDQMKRLHTEGTSIVLVSHSIDAVRLLAPRAVLLHAGRLAFDGPIEDAIGAYHSELGARSDDTDAALLDRKDRGAVLVTHQEVLDDDGGPTSVGRQDRSLRLRAELAFQEDVDSPQLFFVVRDETGAPVYTACSAPAQGGLVHRAGGHSVVEVAFTPRFGGGGTYSLELLVTDKSTRDLIGQSPSRTLLYVTPRLGIYGVADLEARLQLDGRSVDEHPPLTLGPDRGPTGDPPAPGALPG